MSDTKIIKFDDLVTERDLLKRNSVSVIEILRRYIIEIGIGDCYTDLIIQEFVISESVPMHIRAGNISSLIGNQKEILICAWTALSIAVLGVVCESHSIIPNLKAVLQDQINAMEMDD